MLVLCACWYRRVLGCVHLSIHIQPRAICMLKHSSPLPPSAGFVVTMRFRRQMCTIAPWMGRATSTGASCSPLSTSHLSRSWSSRRRWVGHHCLYSVLRGFSGSVHVFFSSLLLGVCVHPGLTGHFCTGSDSLTLFCRHVVSNKFSIFASCKDNSPCTCDVTIVP